MNLNPDDDHIMDYTTGWDDKYDIGDTNLALSQEVWNIPTNSIVIVRHRKVEEINPTNFCKEKLFFKNQI